MTQAYLLPILKELAATSGRNDKEAILIRERDRGNTALRDFFEASLNPFKTYGLTNSIPEYKCESDVIGSPIETAMRQLYVFADRLVTGQRAKDKLQSLLCSLSGEDAEVLIRIIKKDPDVGLGANTVNKIWPKLIPVMIYMGATPMSDDSLARLDYLNGVYSQNKEDGLFNCAIVNKAGVVTHFGRSGKEYDFKGAFGFLGDSFRNCRIDGEIRVLDPEFSKFLHRKKSNGYVNKYQVGKKAHHTDTTRLCFIVWDVIPLEDSIEGKCELPYKHRLNVLYRAVRDIRQDNHEAMLVTRTRPELRLVDTQIVHSLEAAREMFKRVKAAGEEGLILKEMDGPWQDGKPWWQVKLKNVTETEMKIIGFEEHKKVKGRLGAFILASEDGKVVTNCGSGLTEEESFDYWERQKDLIGRVVSTKWESIIWKENEEKLSLNLPIYAELREDKDVANTLAEMITEWEGTTGCTIEKEISDKL